MAKRNGKLQTSSGLSERAEKLLKLEEGYDVDFKEKLSGLDVEDIVAFANSPIGGAILIGVRETTDDTGRQVGQIIGCDIGDQHKQTILNKAEECIPPVDIEVYVEEAPEGSFYRIEIPSGSHKPYCTRKGIYKMRKDGRNAVLHPQQLLAILLEQEGGRFVKRFSEATEVLESQLDHFGKQFIEIESTLERVLFDLHDISSNAADAVSSAIDAMMSADDAVSNIDELQLKMNAIQAYTFYLNKKLNAILNFFGIEDPHIASLRQIIQKAIQAIEQEGSGELDQERIFKRIWKSNRSFWSVDEDKVNRIISEEIAKHIQQHGGQ